MRGLLYSSLVLATTASALTVDKRQDAAAKPLTMPLTHFGGGNGQDKNDGKYFGIKVSIGTPPKEFTMALTLEQEGITLHSAAMYEGFMPVEAEDGSNTTTEVWVSGAPEYAFDNRTSSTFVAAEPNTTDSDVFRFLTQETYMVVGGYDTIEIGGATVTNASLELMFDMDLNQNNESTKFLPDGGIFGMGPGYWIISKESSPHVSTSGWTQAAWASTGFALALDRDPANCSGIIIYGGEDESKYEGPLTETPIANVSTWSTRLEAVRVDNATVAGMDHVAYPPEGPTLDADGKSKLTYINVLMDPSSNYIYWPEEAIPKILRLVPNSKQEEGTKFLEKGDWTVPCDTESQIILTLGGIEYPIEKDTWVIPNTGDGRGNCQTRFKGLKGSLALDDICFPMGPLMRNFYASYGIQDGVPKMKLARAVGGSPWNVTAPPPVQEVKDPNQWVSGAGVGATASTAVVFASLLVALVL